LRRAIILVLDSLGIGGAPDAAAFGDLGANTLLHIAEACAAGECDSPGIREGGLHLPNLARLGLGLAAADCTGAVPPGLETVAPLRGAYGHAVEISHGKDTPSGHWEMAGVPVDFDWGYFPTTQPCFPPALTDALITEGRLAGLLGNRHASGTEILAELGAEHIRTGKPIVYTSADSVFQIAAHEHHFGLARLYDLCAAARKLVDDWNIGRVIARPFIGERAQDFQRTGHRRDYTTPPPAPTLLDRLVEAGGNVVSVGKVADIFAHRGISKTVKADGNQALFEATLKEIRGAGDRSLVFTNFIDFDSRFGHRRDITGYASALEYFDTRLPELDLVLENGDLVIITADHGNDPTWSGTDHTREQVPVLVLGPRIKPGALGERSTFADIGQTVATHLGLAALPHGTALL
jgi:phosphopentomutase